MYVELFVVVGNSNGRERIDQASNFAARSKAEFGRVALDSFDCY